MPTLAGFIKGTVKWLTDKRTANVVEHAINAKNLGGWELLKTALSQTYSILRNRGLKFSETKIFSSLQKSTSQDNPPTVDLILFLILNIINLNQIKLFTNNAKENRPVQIVVNMIMPKLQEICKSKKTPQDQAQQISKITESILQDIQSTTQKLKNAASTNDILPIPADQAWFTIESTLKAQKSSLSCMSYNPLFNTTGSAFAKSLEEIPFYLLLSTPLILSEKEINSFKQSCEILTEINNEIFNKNPQIESISDVNWTTILNSINDRSSLDHFISNRKIISEIFGNECIPRAIDFIYFYFNHTTQAERRLTEENKANKIKEIKATAALFFDEQKIENLTFRTIIQDEQTQNTGEQSEEVEPEILQLIEEQIKTSSRPIKNEIDEGEHEEKYKVITKHKLDENIAFIRDKAIKYFKKTKSITSELPRSLRKHIQTGIKNNIRSIIEFHTTLCVPGSYNNLDAKDLNKQLLEIYGTLCQTHHSGTIETIFSILSQLHTSTLNIERNKETIAKLESSLANFQQPAEEKQSSTLSARTAPFGTKLILSEPWAKIETLKKYRRNDIELFPLKCRKRIFSEIEESGNRYQVKQPLINSLLKLTFHTKNFPPHTRPTLKKLHQLFSSEMTKTEESRKIKQQIHDHIEINNPLSAFDIYLSAIRTSLTGIELHKSLSDTIAATRSQVIKSEPINPMITKAIGLIVNGYDYKKKEYKPSLVKNIVKEFLPATPKQKTNTKLTKENKKMILALGTMVYLTILSSNLMAFFCTKLTVSAILIYSLTLTTAISAVLGYIMYRQYLKSDLNREINEISTHVGSLFFQSKKVRLFRPQAMRANHLAPAADPDCHQSSHTLFHPR